MASAKNKRSLSADDIKNSLSTTLGRRDETPNQQLADQIASLEIQDAVKNLFALLKTSGKAVQHDCIKVIYEVAAKHPAMVADYVHELLPLLTSKDNRLQWGAMTALDAITPEIPHAIHDMLPQLLQAADKGSVITRDHFVNILIRLCAIKKHESQAFGLLLEQLLTCPSNQLPMYAENSFHLLTSDRHERFIKILRGRLPDVVKESKRKRISALLGRIRG